MDFKDMILSLGQKIEKLKDSLQTEEATKNALIMPMLTALGYNVFDPTEVMPEYTCDIGTKKGEKIDYAILKDGEPVILIECKHWAQDLSLHDNQLLRYFGVSTAKFGVLTNGIIWRFYTDLEKPNQMDTVPFLEVNLLALKDAQIEELKKFHKSYFNIETVLSTANELKYLGELRAVIQRELADPSPDFTRYVVKQVYSGLVTQRVIDEFRPLLKRSISYYINDIISDRLKVAMKESETTPQTGETQEEEAVEDVVDDGIVTTDEELDAYHICRAILSEYINPERITYKDTKRYFAVLLDGKVTQTICRFRFNYRDIRRISFITADKLEENVDLENGDLCEIYKYKDKLVEIAQRYDK